MHWVYSMKADAPDPIHSGDMKSWFLFYRWEKEEEVWLPVEEKELLLGKPSPGDTLWFSMNGEVMGYVPILRLEENYAQGYFEVWYDAGAVHKAEARQPPPKFGPLIFSPIRTFYAPEDQGLWGRLKEALDGAQAASGA